MSHWIALLVAVAANIGANISFKHFIQNTEFTGLWSSLGAISRQPAFWIGLTLGLCLLGAYLYALRGIPISVAYPMATSLSIAGITCAGVLIYGEAFGARMAIGVVSVIAGVVLIATS